jgi:hypothetical protein
MSLTGHGWLLKQAHLPTGGVVGSGWNEVSAMIERGYTGDFADQTLRRRQSMIYSFGALPARSAALAVSSVIFQNTPA